MDSYWGFFQELFDVEAFQTNLLDDGHLRLVINFLELSLSNYPIFPGTVEGCTAGPERTPSGPPWQC